MTDLTDFLSNPPKSEGRCNISKWLSEQDDESRESFVKALLNPEWSIASLCIGLRKFGLHTSDETLRKHRNGMCRTCGPF